MRRTLPSGFYPELEALRGVASLMVLLGHCYISVISAGKGTSEHVNSLLLRMLDIVLDPQPAVLLFFVLSGFVLGCQLQSAADRGEEFSYWSFLSRRAFRILPMMWASLCFAVALLAVSSAFDNQAVGSLHRAFSRVWANAALVDYEVNVVTWSLFIELIGSAAVPLLFVVATRSGPVLNSAVLICLLCILLWVRRPVAAQFMLFFDVGLLVGYVAQPSWLQYPTALVVAAIAAILYLASPEFFDGESRLWGQDHWHKWMWAEAFACAAIVYLIAAQQLPMLNKILNLGPIRHLGRISFSVYLLHWPIVLFCLSVWRRVSDAWGLQPPKLLVFAILAVCVAPLTIALSEVTYERIERPFMALARRISSSPRRLDIAPVPSSMIAD
jgi:peptidoglycan/LPS O-acetylase OafA/YrhL